ncbi:hypothetical protein [Microbacterium panaciterrae]|uniref:AraC family transcriptional regulator n=1 Tax=Microbacterium panaciterrae TaxID=985759 RepID=A0ABP8PEW1_9MICO
MGISADFGRVLHRLGEQQDETLVIVKVGEVLASQYEFDKGERWAWGSSESGYEEGIVGVLVADAPFTLCTPDGTTRIVPPGTFCFVHPDFPIQTVGRSRGRSLGAWIPREALDASGLNFPVVSMALPRGILADGVRAFLSALLAGPVDDSGSAQAEYLLTEMVVGLLADAVAGRPRRRP